MPKTGIDINSIRVDIKINQDTDVVDLEVAHNLSNTMEEAQVMFYLDALNGLTYKIKCELENCAFQGALLREIATLRESLDELVGEEELDEDEIDFEPDQTLVDLIRERRSKSKSNVVDFKKKLH